MLPTTEVPAAPPAKRRFSRYHLALLLLFLVVWVWAAIDPVSRTPGGWRTSWSSSVCRIVGLGFYFRLSNLSYALITIFMMMHAVGSRYTYAEVPFGFILQDWFGAERNMYDRQDSRQAAG